MDPILIIFHFHEYANQGYWILETSNHWLGVVPKNTFIMSKQKHIGQPITDFTRVFIKAIFSGAEIKQLNVGIIIIRMEYKTYTYNVGPGSSYVFVSPRKGCL